MKVSRKERFRSFKAQMLTGAIMFVLGLAWFAFGDFSPDQPTQLELERRQMQLSEDYLYATTNKQRNKATRKMQLEDKGVRAGRENVWRGRDNAPFLRVCALTICGLGGIILIWSGIGYLRLIYRG